jgi:hypothetical protein
MVYLSQLDRNCDGSNGLSDLKLDPERKEYRESDRSEYLRLKNHAVLLLSGESGSEIDVAH